MWKIIIICFLSLSLFGCKANSNLEDNSLETIPSVTSAVEDSELMTKQMFFESKGYLDILSMLLNEPYDIYLSGLNVEFIDDTLKLSDDDNSTEITYSDDGGLNLSIDKLELYYLKRNQSKSATASLNLNRKSRETAIINGELHVNDNSGQAYDFLYNDADLTLLDNEVNSSTLGNPIRFTESLNCQLVTRCQQLYLLSAQIFQVLNDFDNFYHQYLETKDLSKIPSGKEYLDNYKNDLLATQIPTQGCDASFLSANYRTNFDNKFNLNDETKWLMDGLSKLEMTLGIVSKFEDEFENVNEIDLMQIIGPLLSYDPYSLGCDVEECRNGLGDYIHLDYPGLQGYPMVSRISKANQFVYDVFGIENAFIASKNQVINGVYIDADNQWMFYQGVDGDWPLAQSGVVILNQVNNGDEISIELIKYRVYFGFYGNYLISSGNFLAEVTHNQSYLNVNDMIIDFVYDNLANFDTYQLILKDMGNSTFYRIMSLTKQ